jgi:tetraacyldisaccharide 4'-kinase
MFERLWKNTLRRYGFSVWQVPAALFWVLSLFYACGAWINRHWPRLKVRLSVPVISVGNISVGGSGKTPLVAAIGGELQNRGLQVGIVARGYGRSSRDALVGTGSKLSRLSTDLIGDEVLLMAEKLPDVIFAVHNVKAIAAKTLMEKSQVDIVIIDDGFQHFGLHRDFEIVALDATIPSQWLHPLPYGVLREPLSNLRLADMVVITRGNLSALLNEVRALTAKFAPSAGCWEVRFVNSSITTNAQWHAIDYLREKSVFLFAGIGNFEALKRQVAQLSGTLVAAVELSDHQQYDEATIGRLKNKIKQCSPQVVLTTAKDWVKLRHFDFGREFYYLDLQLEFVPPLTELTSCIIERLGLKQKTP